MMNNIDETLLNAIERYYNHLAQFGKSSKMDIKVLSILVLIKGIIDGPMSNYVTNKDYNILNGVLNCLYGNSCLVTFNQFCENRESILFDAQIITSPLRLMESNAIKSTENDNLRYIS